MSQSGNREVVIATSGVYFTATLAQNAGLSARIPLPESIAAGRHARCLVQTLQITSFDRLDWEVWLFANKQFQSAGDPTLERFLGYWGFLTGSGDGKQIGGAGLYHYYIDGLGVQYLDEDGHNDPASGCFLNVLLVNRSAGAKTAGAWFQMTFGCEPTLD